MSLTSSGNRLGFEPVLVFFADGPIGDGKPFQCAVHLASRSSQMQHQKGRNTAGPQRPRGVQPVSSTLPCSRDSRAHDTGMRAARVATIDSCRCGRTLLRENRLGRP